MKALSHSRAYLSTNGFGILTYSSIASCHLRVCYIYLLPRKPDLSTATLWSALICPFYRSAHQLSPHTVTGYHCSLPEAYRTVVMVRLGSSAQFPKNRPSPALIMGHACVPLWRKEICSLSSSKLWLRAIKRPCQSQFKPIVSGSKAHILGQDQALGPSKRVRWSKVIGQMNESHPAHWEPPQGRMW